MNANKRVARIVGIFYIAATVAGLVGLAVEDPVLLDNANYLIDVSANEIRVITGTLCELIMAVAVVGIAITAHQVLKKHNASIAIGYVGARLVEGVIYIIGAISLLTLLTLSQEFAAAGTPDASYFHTLGELLLAVRDWGGHVILDVAVFPLGALIFYAVLFQARLVPRWLSGWGLIGAVAYWAAGVLVLFAVFEPLSTIHIVLQAPLGIQELALALWLIVKGFSSPVITSEAAGATLNKG
jgi:hypothetical protein